MQYLTPVVNRYIAACTYNFMNNLTTFYKTLKSFLVCLFFIGFAYDTKANGFDDTAKYELKLRERPIIKKVTENGKTKNKKQSEYVLRLFKNGKHLIEFDAILDSFYSMEGKPSKVYVCNKFKRNKEVTFKFKRTKEDVSLRENYMSAYMFGRVGWKREGDIILIQYSTSTSIMAYPYIHSKGNGQFFVNLREKRSCGLYFHEVVYDSLFDWVSNWFIERTKAYRYVIDSVHFNNKHDSMNTILLNGCCDTSFRQWKVGFVFMDEGFPTFSYVNIDIPCNSCSLSIENVPIYTAEIDFQDSWLYRTGAVNKEFRPFFFPELPILRRDEQISFKFYKIPKKYIPNCKFN
jgi:hypothetical protein